jgi:hypothetical protein
MYCQSRLCKADHVYITYLMLQRQLSQSQSQSYFTTGGQSQSQSYIATDGRSISKSWCRAPSGAHDQIIENGKKGIRLWQEDFKCESK